MNKIKRLSLLFAILPFLIGISYALELHIAHKKAVAEKRIKENSTLVIAKRCLAGDIVELYTFEAGAYEWQKDGNSIGITSDTYKPTTSGTYRILKDGEVSNEITITFDAPTASFSHNATNTTRYSKFNFKLLGTAT